MSDGAYRTDHAIAGARSWANPWARIAMMVAAGGLVIQIIGVSTSVVIVTRYGLAENC